MLDYELRGRLLAEMGFKTYSAYLGSSLWAEIRAKEVERDEGVCRLCFKNAAAQVHHSLYSRAVLLGEDLRWLTAVCGGCHRYVEFDRKTGKKRDGKEVGVAFRRAEEYGRVRLQAERSDPLVAEFRAIVRG